MNIQNISNELFFQQLHPGHFVPAAGPDVPLHGHLRRTEPMLLPIPKVLTEAQVARCRELMERATWVDGKITAGHQSAKAKDNLQIPEGSPEAREMGEMIGKALEQIPLFVSAALPTKIFPPAVQPLRAGHDLRRPRGQRHPPDPGDALPRAHRPLRHPLHQPARGVRRRRAGRGGHLRHPRGEAPGRAT